MQEHKPVMLNEVLEVFKNAPLAVHNCFDGTFGRGGHTRAILETFPQANVTAFDWDKEAIEYARIHFQDYQEAGRLRLYHSSYKDFSAAQQAHMRDGFPRSFDCMLLDLGVSSPQLDQAERGFSFYHEGPLDMRMDQRLDVTAADIVNGWSEKELNELFMELGEIPRPFRVVRALVHDRKTDPFVSTRQLASLIERVEGWHKKGFHPATRYFMALRLQVNRELPSLREALPELIAALADKGRLAVITFHSLEDRIVKQVFKENLHQGWLVNKKVIVPSEEEIKVNPRARSAKLRAFQKGQPEKKNKYERSSP